ncbi:hypothetical protein PGB90_010310 [Kerria lacca]
MNMPFGWGSVRNLSYAKIATVPIITRVAANPLKSKIISCKCTQYPLLEACAITIHKF